MQDAFTSYDNDMNKAILENVNTVIFDLDGTLWKTDDSYVYSYHKLVEKYSGSFDKKLLQNRLKTASISYVETKYSDILSADIIDRLVALQTFESEVKDYKIIDEYTLDKVPFIGL